MAGAEVTTSTYDEPVAGRFNTGRLTTLENADAVIRYEYLSGGQVFREATRLKTAGVEAGPTCASSPTGTPPASSTESTFLTTTVDPDHRHRRHLSYDYARRLKSLPGLIDDIAYNAAGQALTVDYANGVRSAFWYHPTRGWVSRSTTSARPAACCSG